MSLLENPLYTGSSTDPSKPSSIRLVSRQSCQNSVLWVVFCVWGIARSYTEPNQANMVVVERYALSFWRNGHEERVHCGKAHYCGAKTKSFQVQMVFQNCFHWSFWYNISVRFLTVNRRFLCTNSLIWLTYSLSVDVDGHPEHSKSSTRSLPSFKSLYHL